MAPRAQVEPMLVACPLLLLSDISINPSALISHIILTRMKILASWPTIVMIWRSPNPGLDYGFCLSVIPFLI